MQFRSRSVISPAFLLDIADFRNIRTCCNKLWQTQILHIPYDNPTYSTRKSTKYNLKSHTKWRVETSCGPHDPLISWGGGYPKAPRIPGGGTRKPTVGSLGEPTRCSLGLFGAWSEWSDASCTQLCVLDGTLARRSRGRWLRSGGMVGEGIHQKLLNCMNHWTIRVVYSRDKNCDFRFLKPEKKNGEMSSHHFFLFWGGVFWGVLFF